MNEKKNNQKFVQSILFLYHDGGTLPTPTWRSLVALAVIEYVTKVCVVVLTDRAFVPAFNQASLFELLQMFLHCV